MSTTDCTSDTDLFCVYLSVSGTAARRGEPVTFGLPLARGAVRPETALAIRFEDRLIPVQAAPLDLWADGSVRWLLLDAQIDRFKGQLELVAGTAQPPSVGGVRTARRDGAVIVTTGALQAEFRGDARFPLARLENASGANLLDEATSAVVLRDAEGHEWSSVWQGAVVEADGPLRTAVRTLGTARRGDLRLELDLVWSFFAGSPVVKVRATLRNVSAASHPGGKWDLGDPKSIQLAEAAFAFGSALPDAFTEVHILAEPGAPRETCRAPVSLFQASSGGEHWNSSNHVNRHRQVALDFRGYRVEETGRPREGLRATPTVSAIAGATSWAVAARYFWEVFPKAMDIAPREFRISLFPRQSGDPQELQPGEQTTWEFAIAFGPDPVSSVPLDWVTSPSLVHPSPAYVASTGAIPYLTEEAKDPSRAYQDLVHLAIEGGDSFEAKREVIDEYGWRHFGDIYGDHEAIFAKGEAPLVSHYNNQYDPTYGALCQFLRSGNLRWWCMGVELAAHVRDIDIYHTNDDKSAYNGGMFWHTYHYVDADTSTHRSYPSRGKANGGGPSGGHVYSTGLMHAYFLTGDARFKDAAIGLGDYIIDSDDGRRTVFRWLDASPTGHATASGSPNYHGPGRAPGNSLNALIDAHRLTGDDRYLGKAREIVRRCIHPRDNVADRNLLDAENKWFYLIFLQALGKLLDHLDERGQQDEFYFYTRESLLHYVRWMAEYERPYLDRAEELEYPTETWAAQDMRKSEVFQIAARHATEPERGRFFERATFFHEHTKKLWSMETRALCRPMVLLMANGWTRAWHVGALATLPPPPVTPLLDFGAPQRFVSQKARAIAKIRRLVVAAGVAGAGAAAALVWWLISR